MEENTNTTTTNTMNPMLIAGVIIAVLVIGAVVVLGNRGSSDTETESMTVADESKGAAEDDTIEGDDAAMAENMIEVEGGAFYFEPNEIRVKAGEPVTIKLNSVDMMHDFAIDELNLRTALVQGGSSYTVTFTPTEPGEYEFYCSVGNHKAQGMVGTLIVE